MEAHDDPADGVEYVQVLRGLPGDYRACEDLTSHQQTRLAWAQLALRVNHLLWIAPRRTNGGRAAIWTILPQSAKSKTSRHDVLTRRYMSLMQGNSTGHEASNPAGISAQTPCGDRPLPGNIGTAGRQSAQKAGSCQFLSSSDRLE